MNISIHNETAADIDTITQLTEAAFQHEQHSSHTEQFIVTALRRADQLTVSLVAVAGEEVVGHVAVSPVSISSGAPGWYGLGPISVWPDRQGQGIGSALMSAALERLRQLGAAGCVVLGDPGYYDRFGFEVYPGLELPGIPAQYFQAISFGGAVPTGEVKYHAAFDATE
ncbi:putative acetyltransferase [Pseudomonas sp. ok272]|uniref:GNAT family N-acetyltransferase n=1 Tax=unclassified Pseudomonas TaxID=196821 RepID=UPI0008C33458|nr:MULTISPECIES: N-acetyltransferase [unclassified Pseudomonas]SEN11190.1 putative acetyltransferase [Pseudomonas sp. ok272]SFN04298.1 putative acetyltransferase [Pseudomonas sp. ok602]